MIKIENLNKKFDEKQILKDINFKIEDATFLVIKGPSGSGKSTLLSIISGLARPTSGSVFYNNLNISKLPEKELGEFRNQKIGFVFQKFNLLENMTVYENILPPVIINKKHTSKEKILNVLKQFNIDKLANTKVRKLSGGEQQRVALARALINNPEIIIADEPTANLDLNLKMETIKLFKNINQQGKTIIVATHDEIFLEIDGIKVIQMKDGTISG